MNKAHHPDLTRRGIALCPEDREHALRAYVNRYTGSHKPAWARPSDPVQFTDDKDWLANTFFAVRRDGRLNLAYRFCESRPTWPKNPELRMPNPMPVFCPVPEK